MGVMTKMRDQTGVVLWILVIAFGVIFMLQDTQVFDVIGATGQDVIVVDGEPVTVTEYQQAIQQQIQAYQQNGQEVLPQTEDAIRERVYNSFVDDRLRTKAMDDIGIQVTDDEVYSLVLGETPDPIITAYFSDGQGGVDRALLQNFIDNPEALPQLIQLEDYLRQNRRTQKLNSLINATVRVTPQQVEEEYRRRNLTVNTQYVALRYAAVPDTEIEVTDGDLRSFYNANKDDFARETSYALEYVAIPRLPSAADTASVMDEMERLKERFVTTESDSTFLARYSSERPYSGEFFRRDELDLDVADAVFNNLEVGAVVGPYISGSEVHMTKVIDTRPTEERVIRARHILLRGDSDDVRDNAADLVRRIRGGEDFATLAAEFGTDGTAQEGGDLGWFGPGRMVKPFEDAAFGAPIGRVIGPVKTDFGFHVIEVTDRATQDVQLADFVLSITPSVTTESDIRERLGDLQYFAEENGDFATEAERAGLTVQTVLAEAEQQFIPGLGRSRTLSNFLTRADAGDVSEVVELDTQFIVAHVTEITPEGFRPFDEVKAELEPRVRLEKKKTIQLEKLRNASGDLNAMATSVGGSVQSADIQFATTAVPGLGREPKFVGTAMGLDAGETSGIIEGENAAYVIQATSVTEPAPITDTDRTSIRQELQNQRQGQVRNQWLQALREDADINDRRRLFQL
ncbi:MAG: peptidyl-prolyl cis-trans isomerase [Rhodothermales bacterium]